jgi:predicted ATPase
VIISAAAADLVAEDAAAQGWTVVDLGQYELKGVGQSERLHRVDMPGIDVVRTAPRARPKTPSTVPGTPKRIIGRAEDIRGATELIQRDMVRLVSLTGPGGTGKTRLAIEIARSLEEKFPDGVVFVDLSAVRDPERFMPVVGRALGVRESGDRTIAAGLASVIGDGRLLLVIDNVEQLLPTVSSHVSELIGAMPNVKVLVTTRSPLRISWEHEYPVPPLELPELGDDHERIDETAAVALFAERAKAARPLFEMNDVTRPVVVDVVRRLDGLPLAIELAAARLRMFSVEELQQRLDDRLGLLDRGSTDSPERHRTLRAAIGWSHDLLTEDERVLFRRLAVFSGGWTLAAAVAVCCDDEFREPKVLDSLEELVAKSLVVFTINEEGRPRYRLLETLREFAVEQLRDSGEDRDVRLRHLEWLQGAAERVLIVLPTPEFAAFLDDVERERFNIREGLAWAVANKVGTERALRICGMLPLFWDTRGFVAEGLRWTRALVAVTTAEGDTEARGMAHTAMGWLEMLAGEPEESEWALVTAERMFRDMGNENWLGRALSMRGMTTYNRGLLDEAEEQFNEAIVLCRQNGLDWLADAWCTYGLAHVALSRGDFAAAEPLLIHCFEYSRANGLSWGVGHTQLSLSVMAFMLGDMEQSVARMLESIRVRAELRDSRGLCDCIGMMALHASVGGDHDLAATLIGAAEVAREASGDHLVPWQQPLLEQAIVAAQANLGDDYEARFMEGRRLTMNESIALIMERFETSETERSAVSA